VVTAAGVPLITEPDVYPLTNMLDFTAKACRQYVIVYMLVHIWFGQAELQLHSLAIKKEIFYKLTTTKKHKICPCEYISIQNYTAYHFKI
jgi:hypothetical protein